MFLKLFKIQKTDADDREFQWGGRVGVPRLQDAPQNVIK